MRYLSALFAFAALFFGSGFAMAGTRTVTLAVDNMICSVCPLTVKKSISAVRGVSDVKVSYKKKIAVVTSDDSETTVRTLIDASSMAGYPAHIKFGAGL